MIREGFEPSTHSLEGCCSIQLSYRTMFLRVPLMMNTRRCHYQLRPNLRPGFYFFPPHCVPWAGLEPARVKHWFLRPACLPFHHLGIFFILYVKEHLCTFSTWVSVYRLPESNRYEHRCSRDFKSLVSTYFTKAAFFIKVNIRRISTLTKLVQTLFDKIVKKFFVVFCKIL